MLKNEQIINSLTNLIHSTNVFNADCEIIEFMLDNAEINIPDKNRYFVNTSTEEITTLIKNIRAEKFRKEIAENKYSEGEEVLAYTGLYDFGHTSTEWNSIISLGIYGIRKRIEKYELLNPKNKSFYSGLIKVYDAILRYMVRASEEATKHGKHEMSEGLKNLTKRAPETLFEALQTSMIYYTMQQMFDGSILRTLGRLDSILYPFYMKETKKTAYDLIYDYFAEFDRHEITANIPFALGGTDSNGNSNINELSYLLLDVYAKSQFPNIKLHILCSKNTPDSILKNAFESIRNGNNSIVFMSDEKVIESLEKLGEDHEDAVDYHVVGCYECGGNGEITSSCNARVNIPKALELALNNGKDILTDKVIGLETGHVFNSYEDLYTAFLKQLRHLCSCAIELTNIWESHYKEIHSAPIYSATYTSSLENGRDIYTQNGAKYNNSSVNALGLATAVDSLIAIKKIVFENREKTFDEFVQILKNNWDNEQQLRLYIKNKLPKFGQNNPFADNTAKNITKFLANNINGIPNTRGGVYRLGLFSIDWRWEFGKKTAASADGRFAGDPISQNTSATFGADINGITSHLLSVASIDASDTPNGSIVDIDLHSTAVKGDTGLQTLLSTLRTYFSLGGFAVHYNVLDTNILKEAKLNPEKHPNLQVRLCGWNARFASLTEKEQDEFIKRSEI